MPSSGPFLTSSRSCLSTSEASMTSSSAQPSLLCLRHTSCRLAVRKPVGLKKPVSQKELGRPLRSQFVNCSARVRMLTNHTPMLGATSCDTLVHVAGTRAMKSASSASARSGDMTMVPAMASLRLASIARTTEMTFCSRSISCLRQMLSGLPMPPRLLIPVLTSSALKSGGSLACRSSTIFSTTSSRVSPPPPPPSLGWMSRMVPSTALVCEER
mmetsp:Transcript_10877/g.27104  ORF Transcript_10877/g.27104 Transcript_10877/m.27104 type:complete len:214 (+) Transcript_10877:326-967(+)